LRGAGKLGTGLTRKVTAETGGGGSFYFQKERKTDQKSRQVGFGEKGWKRKATKKNAQQQQS
jgi:hypothetical protein